MNIIKQCLKKSNKKLNKKEIKNAKTETKGKFKEKNKKILNMTGKKKNISIEFFSSRRLQKDIWNRNYCEIFTTYQKSKYSI